MGEIEKAILSLTEVENDCCTFNHKNSDIIAIFSGEVKSEDIAKVVESKLPHYMFPSRYIHLTEMPMNLNGKIDRIKLKEEYMEV